MIHFEWPWMLLCAPLPWLLRFALPRAQKRNEAGLFAPFLHTNIGAGTADHGVGHTHISWHIVLVVSWLLLVAAALRPQWLGEPMPVPETGRNIMLAIDVSGSMEATDLASGSNASLTRLDVVKQVAGQFIERRVGDRVGLILFGTQAYVQAPLSFDTRTVRRFLSESAIGIAGRETAIGDAVGLALKRLGKAPGERAVLVLLTDGVNTAGAVTPQQAASLAGQSGLKIYTIGVGAQEMRVRSLFGTRVVNPSADLDEVTLRAMAEGTGGRYFRARELDELEAIYRELDELEPAAGEDRQLRPVTALYPWPLGLAFVLSLALASVTLWKPRYVMG
ncbi:MAG: Ca-activated chloride channel family protein [Gammaproteobacteria bacterium]|jgi:Ca-activated chloride channel family protein